MAIFDIEYTFDDLIRTTNYGIEISSFVQMRDAIAKRYKEVYGNDIDIDSTTADGQYIMMQALMLFNGYSSLYYLSQNLDPSGAKGTFLDRLCSFNNVFRKDSEPSYAYLYVKYTGKSNEYNSVIIPETSCQEITCIDKSGKLWTWREGKGSEKYNTVFSASDEKPHILKFECEESGEITAQADETLKILDKNELPIDALTNDNHGWISQTIDTSIYPFEVWQADDAVVGTNQETDVALRSRRLVEMGNRGVTVANGLIGGLLSIQGIEEAKLYTNTTERVSNTYHTKDGSDIEMHDVYVCVRYKEGVTVPDAEVGQMIYNKMTPGIVTAPINKGFYPNVSNINAYEKYDDEGNAFGKPHIYTINIYQGILNYPLHWKECKSVNPSMHLEFLFNKESFDQTIQFPIITNAIQKYTFGLTIFDNLTIPNLLSFINSCDNSTNNQKNFVFTSGKISKRIKGTEDPSTSGSFIPTYSTDKIASSTSTDIIGDYFENCDTYYKYPSDMIHFTMPNIDSNTSLYPTAQIDIFKHTEAGDSDTFDNDKYYSLVNGIYINATPLNANNGNPLLDSSGESVSDDEFVSGTTYYIKKDDQIIEATPKNCNLVY